MSQDKHKRTRLIAMAGGLLLVIAAVVFAVFVVENGVITASTESRYSRLVNIRSLEELQPYLATKEPEELRIAILTVHKIQDQRVPELLSTIWNEGIIRDVTTNQVALQDPRVRLSVAVALLSLRHGDRQAYRRYIYENVNSPSTAIRAYAANALGSVGDKHAVESLALLIQHDDREVTLNAVSALFKIAYETGPAKKNAVDALKELLSDAKVRDSLVREQLSKAYEKIQAREHTSNHAESAGIQDKEGMTSYEEANEVFLKGDHAQALRLLLPLAEQGDRRAQYQLGLIYDYGLGGTTKNRPLALRWYTKAAEQGHVGAQFNLALLHQSGSSEEKDQTEAVRWYKEAAQNGDSQAQELLAKAYEKGWWGLKPSPEKAQYWREKAGN